MYNWQHKNWPQFEFDDSLKEPSVLPSQFPNLLVNGAGGIAVGMATSIPPHNLGEIIDGTIAYIENNDITTDELIQFVKAPDLLIYLRASIPTLVSHIQKRGRDYEESIRLDYLKRLNERYEAWISTYDKGKLLIIDIDNNNFTESQEDLGRIINSIDGEIHGLF